MNRRDMLKTVIGAVAVAVPGEKAEAKCLEQTDRDIALVVKTAKSRLTPDEREQIMYSIDKAMEGTSAENLPVLLCENGVDIEIVRMPEEGQIKWPGPDSVFEPADLTPLGEIS